MAEILKLKKSNCKNCYKCIRHCPVKSIRFSGNQANIVGDECILCGKCFVVCPQNAKEIADGIEGVRVLLSSDVPVIASLAPSFIANYDGAGIEEISRAVEKLGFASAEEAAIGATIVKRDYERKLREDKPNVLISSCCHTVNLLIQKYYPGCVGYLADTLSPMLAHAKDIKQRNPGAKVVFIGPCIAKKDEATRYPGYVDAVLTFEELSQMLKEADITIECKAENNNNSLARFFPTAGGILKTMNERQPEYSYMEIDGIENCIEALNEIQAGALSNCFIEMSSCSGSCIGGPIMEKQHSMPLQNYIRVEKYAGSDDFAVGEYDKGEISRPLEYIERKQNKPSETEIKQILAKMGKTTPEHELNCGSCGYNTCREKALAIYQGKADLTMCLPYLKEKAESFSDNIIENTPNGIIVLNDQLEVQQINKSACTIMNIRRPSDVMGEQVIRILDPKDFLDVMKSGSSICDKRTYLAEYDRYVDQSIIYDRKFNNIICIMRDITEDEKNREHKEEINRQTLEIADNVVDKQMRIVQEIASLLGETAAETKIALTKLKESISDE